MSVDFESISGKTAVDTHIPLPLPVGSYRATLYDVAHLKSSKKGTDCIAFGAQLYESLDADPAELEAFGDWQGYQFKPRATVSPLSFFMTNEDSMNWLVVLDDNLGEWRGFIPEVAKLEITEENKTKRIWAEDDEGNPAECLCLDAVGCDVIITVGHEQGDKVTIYAGITEVHAAS